MQITRKRFHFGIGKTEFFLIKFSRKKKMQFAGGSNPTTVLSCCDRVLWSFFDGNTAVPLSATCHEADASFKSMRHLIEGPPLCPRYEPYAFTQFTDNPAFVGAARSKAAQAEIKAALNYVMAKNVFDLSTYAGLRNMRTELLNPWLASDRKFQKLLFAVSKKAWPLMHENHDLHNDGGPMRLDEFHGLFAHWLVYTCCGVKFLS